MKKYLVRTWMLVLAMLCSLAAATAVADEILTLPSATKIVEEEAFYGDASLQQVVLPEGIKEIRTLAFANSGLTSINLPASLDFIAEDAFDSPEKVQLTAESGTYAYHWAVENKYIIPPIASVLQLNAGTTVFIPEDLWASVTFTPDQEGYYEFYSTGSDNDLNANLLNSEGEHIAFGDGGNNFSVVAWLEAGETYTLEVVSYNGYDVEVVVWVAQYDGIIEAYAMEEDVTVQPGESAVLEVTANATNGNIYYQWYTTKDESTQDDANDYAWIETVKDEPISGATEAKCTLTPDRTTVYICTVSDTFGHSKDVWFWVSIDNDFVVSRKNNQYTIFVAPGEKATLEVVASCRDGEVHYQWYQEIQVRESDEDYYTREIPVDGANGSMLVVDDVTGPRYYYCDASDQYGNSNHVWFGVRVENHLTGSSESGNIVFTEYNTPAELKVIASCDSGDITYAWYKYNRIYQSNGSYYTEEIPIEGAHSATLITEPITAENEYRCRISDNYGNTDMIWIYVRVENHLTAEAVGDTGRFWYISVNDTLEMKVNASCDTGDIFYEWYRDGHKIEGAVGDTCETDPVTAPAYYYCAVTDEFGNFQAVPFEIRVENHLTAEANGSSSLAILPNETAEMKVNASCDVGEITYQWRKTWRVYSDDNTGYYHYEWEEIDGAESSTLISDPILEYSEYYCIVEDEYGNNTSVWFYLRVDNQLTASGSAEYYTRVPLNETTDMKVNASCTVGNLSYQWYKIVETDVPGQSISSIIPDGVGSELTSDPVTKYTQYYCRVSDEFGNETNVWFQLQVENHLTIMAVGDSNRYVPYNEVDQLEVTASCDIGNMTYQWFRNWQLIEGAVSTTVTTDPVTESASYQCQVKDDYGNISTFFFEVRVNNHLTAEAVGNAYRNVTANETAELRVAASCDTGEVTYQWYKNWQMIDGATESTLVTEPVIEYAEYQCSVIDIYENSTVVYFMTGVENHLNANNDGDTWLNVPANENVELKVLANCDIGDIRYQWYKQIRVYTGTDRDNYYTQDQIIDGATGGSLFSEPVTEFTTYCCEVSDDYNNSTRVWFYLRVNNRLETSAEGEPSIFVSANETADLKVNATCAMGNLAYQWYKEITTIYPDGTISSRSTPVSGATGSSLTTDPVTEYIQYYCMVSDDYGNSSNVWFELHVNNHLTAAASGESDRNVPYNEIVEMEVTATCEEGELSYQWYKSWQRIDGATSLKLHTDPVIEPVEYQCEVKDTYGNTIMVYYTFRVENHLITRYDGESYRYVAANESEEMKVTATCDEGELTYQWYKNWQIIEGAVGTTLRSDPVTEAATYQCEVEDIFGNISTLYFYLWVENHLQAEPDGEYSRFVGLNETEELKVNASCDVGNLTYQWYKNWEKIYGAENSSFITDPATRRVSYQCEVTDIYGSSQTVSFELYVENHLSATAEGDNNRTVPINSAEELKVNASCDAGSLSYQWYINWERIDGATTSMLTTDPVIDTIDYECEVRDAFGNITMVWFYLYPEDQ